VARVQRQAEIEGVTERVLIKEKVEMRKEDVDSRFRGNDKVENEKERIDSVFEKNVEEQLAEVNWDELKAAISARLDEAERGKTSKSKFPAVFKVAAGVAAAAAVVFVATMVKMEKPVEMPLENGKHAVVEFIEARGSASVEIIDRNGEGKENGSRAAWIIIRMPEPALADNGTNGHLRDLIRLF